MAICNGVVTAVSRDNKRIQIDDGEWYSAFSAAQLCGAGRGDGVSFSYTTTPPKGPEGRSYNNIKGNVTVTAGGVTPSTSVSSAPARGSAGGFKGGRTFPVGPLDPERSIIRQNSLAHAVKMAECIGYGPDGWEDYVDWVIAMARRVEAYSAGDLDSAIADAAMVGVDLKGY